MLSQPIDEHKPILRWSKIDLLFFNRHIANSSRSFTNAQGDLSFNGRRRCLRLHARTRILDFIQKEMLIEAGTHKKKGRFFGYDGDDLTLKFYSDFVELD